MDFLLNTELNNSKKEISTSSKAFLDIVNTLMKLYGDEKETERDKEDDDEMNNSNENIKTIAEEVGVNLDVCTRDVNLIYEAVKEKDIGNYKSLGIQLVSNFKVLMSNLTKFKTITEDQLTSLRNLVHRMVSLAGVAIRDSDQYFNQFSQARDEVLFSIRKVVISISARSRTVARSISRPVMSSINPQHPPKIAKSQTNLKLKKDPENKKGKDSTDEKRNKYAKTKGTKRSQSQTNLEVPEGTEDKKSKKEIIESTKVPHKEDTKTDKEDTSKLGLGETNSKVVFSLSHSVEFELRPEALIEEMQSKNLSLPEVRVQWSQLLLDLFLQYFTPAKDMWTDMEDIHRDAILKIVSAQLGQYETCVTPLLLKGGDKKTLKKNQKEKKYSNTWR